MITNEELASIVNDTKDGRLKRKLSVLRLALSPQKAQDILDEVDE